MIHGEDYAGRAFELSGINVSVSKVLADLARIPEGGTAAFPADHEKLGWLTLLASKRPESSRLESDSEPPPDPEEYSRAAGMLLGVFSGRTPEDADVAFVRTFLEREGDIINRQVLALHELDDVSRLGP